MLSHIPEALVNRFEVITLSPYSNEDKKAIVSQYIVKEFEKELRLPIILDDNALQALVQKNNEPGVRDLSRELKNICGHILSLRNDDSDETPIRITLEDIVTEEFSGRNQIGFK